MELEQLQNVLDESASRLSQAQLEVIKSRLHKIYNNRFPRKKGPAKYGSVNTTFNDDELCALMQQLPNKKFELLFKCQAFLGLRISEACRLHVSSLRLATREIIFKSSKVKVIDSLRIPQVLFDDMLSFIRDHYTEIQDAQGYVFFKENDNNKNFSPHIKPEYARKVFRQARARANLQEVYDYSEEKVPGHNRRPLYRLSSHSLRRYAVTKFHKIRRDLVLTSRFARHRSPKQTIIYIANNQEELYQDIDLSFKKDVRQQSLIVANI